MGEMNHLPRIMHKRTGFMRKHAQTKSPIISTKPTKLTEIIHVLFVRAFLVVAEDPFLKN